MARCLRCGAGNEWIEPIQREGGQNTATTHYDYRESSPAAPVRSMKEFRERYGESATPDCPACGGTGKVPSEWAQSGDLGSQPEEVIPPESVHGMVRSAPAGNPVQSVPVVPSPAAPAPDVAALRERWIYACDESDVLEASDYQEIRQLRVAGYALLAALEARPAAVSDDVLREAIYARFGHRGDCRQANDEMLDALADLPPEDRVANDTMYRCTSCREADVAFIARRLASPVGGTP